MNTILDEPSSSAANEAGRLKSFSSQAILYVEDEAALRNLRAATAVREHGELFFPASAETFTHITPAPHWGINE